MQILGMSESRWDVRPEESMSSMHLIAAREVVPSGPLSILFLGGIGGVSVKRRGQLLATGEGGGDTYRLTRSSGASILAALDLGGSIQRRIGLSLQMGVEVGGSNAAYSLFQLDAGSW
jgi:hypothetical protein